jgi:hypothetical protein
MFVAAPAAEAIDVYTFKKKRVDQELEGNRGYIMGTPPPPPERKSTRTIIGVDIELPAADLGAGEEKGYDADEKDSEPSSGQKPVTVVTDEDWIK